MKGTASLSILLLSIVGSPTSGRRHTLGGVDNALHRVAQEDYLPGAVYKGSIETLAASRIVNGENATPGEYPSYSWIYYPGPVPGDPGTSCCGGTKIHADIILTAAHCEPCYPINGTIFTDGIRSEGDANTVNTTI